MPQTSPKISIIVPSFNQGAFVEETIQSIINQDYGNYELIIIDGGSTDDSVERIKKYEKQLHYWISEKDSGQSDAINKGLKMVTGDIITWLNSDDLYEKKTLQFVADEFVNDPFLGLLHGKTLLFGEKIKNKIIGPDTEFAIYDYLPYMRFPQPSSFFSKKAIQSIAPLSNDLHYAMDFELVVKCVLQGFKLKGVPSLLSRYRIHPQSKSNNEMAFLEDWTRVFINVLSSLSNGAVYISYLNDVLIRSKTPVQLYPHTVALTDHEVETAFLQHLNAHFHYHYRAHNYSDCKRISNFLKLRYNQFYIENEYKKFMFRLKFVSKFIFTLIRKL